MTLIYIRTRFDTQTADELHWAERVDILTPFNALPLAPAAMVSTLGFETASHDLTKCVQER